MAATVDSERVKWGVTLYEGISKGSKSLGWRSSYAAISIFPEGLSVDLDVQSGWPEAGSCFTEYV